MANMKPKPKKNKVMNRLGLLYKNYFCNCIYMTKREAEQAIRPDPKGYKIVKVQIKILNK